MHLNNSREAYEKRKELGAKKQKEPWSAKDFITVSLSVLAFIVAAGSAYFGWVRQSDELIMTFSSYPAITRIDNKLQLSEFRVVLMNSGNRAAVVHYVWLLMDQTTLGASNTECPNREDVGIDVVSVVLKEKEIVEKSIQSKAISQDGPAALVVSDQNIRNDIFPLEVCLDVSFSTPSETLQAKRITVIRDEHYSFTRGFDRSKIKERTRNVPVVLVKRRGNIFTD